MARKPTMGNARFEGYVDGTTAVEAYALRDSIKGDHYPVTVILKVRDGRVDRRFQLDAYAADELADLLKLAARTALGR